MTSPAKYFGRACSLIAGCLCVFSLAIAAPPKNWNYLKEKPSDFRPCKTMSTDTLKILRKKGVFRLTPSAGTISKTTESVLVIRVDFSDSDWLGTSVADTEKFFSGVQHYFRENSYGVYTVTATVVPSSGSPYRLGTIDLYNDETDSSLLALRNDAVAKAVADGIDVTGYDYLMVCHAGYGEEETGYSRDIWSLYYDDTLTIGAKTFPGVTVVPEKSPSTDSSPLGVVCHEFAHQLGLPDLYNTSASGGVSTCGAWTLMDYPYGAHSTGKNPPHLDPWCKSLLGFIDLSTRTGTGGVNSIAFGDIETSVTTGYYRIPVAVANNTESFIVEYRMPDSSKISYDLDLPGSGMLVWHIDESLAVPTSVSYENNTVNNGVHAGVDLVEADGTAVYPPGQSGDAFNEGSVFASPLSNSFSGLETGIFVSHSAFTTSSANSVVGVIAASADTNVDKLVNYPNPAGSGYPHTKSNVLTTIVVHLTRPPSVMNMVIYDLTGERVELVQKSAFTMRMDISKDLHWVYEYDWDGKNESGKDVAPGVYFYRLKADNETKVGKLAIVR